MYRSLLLLISERVVQLAASLLGTIFIARSLALGAFGYYQYAIGLTSLLSVAVGVGLVPVVKRRLVSTENVDTDVVDSASSLRLVMFGIAYAFLAVFALASGESGQIALLLVGLAMLKESILVCDLWFQVQERFQFLTVSSMFSALLGLALKYVGLVTEQGLLYFASVYAIEALVLAGVLFAFYLKESRRWLFGRLKMANVRSLVAESWPIWLSAISVVIYMRIDLLMLKSMVSEQSLAHFACASRMAELSFVLPNVLATLVFPRLVAYEDKPLSVSRFTRGYFSAGLYVAILAAGAYALLGSFAIPFVFGGNYASSVGPFLVLLCSLPFVSLGVARGQYLTFWGKLRPMLPISIFGAFLNVLLNLVFIPRWGIMGAASASVVSQAFASLFSGLFFPSLRSVFVVQISSVFRLSSIGYFVSCLSRPIESSRNESRTPR